MKRVWATPHGGGPDFAFELQRVLHQNFSLKVLLKGGYSGISSLHL